MKKLMLAAMIALSTSLPALAQENETASGPQITTAATKPHPTVDLATFIAENASLPASRSGKKESLKVTLRFTVDEEGDIGEVTVLKSSGDRGLDDEAVRIVEEMPKWKPAMSKGKPVKVQYTLPMKFTLEPEEGNTKADRAADKKAKSDEEKEARRETARENKDKREQDKEDRDDSRERTEDKNEE